ncbi:hypothetical protein KGQ71_00175 [Patescibacteria group bacterium]|nr:hypothetical protein [Patescibacteria group bacterium]
MEDQSTPQSASSTPPVQPTSELAPSTVLPSDSASDQAPTQPFGQPPSQPFGQPTSQSPGQPGPNPFAAVHRQNRWRQIWLIIGAVVTVVLLIGFYLYRSSQGGILVLDTTPNLTITLNGQPVATRKTGQGVFVSARAGVYRLNIKRPNFSPFTEDIKLGWGQQISVRPVYALQPSEGQVQSGGIDFVRPSLDQTAVFFLGNNRQTIYRMEISNQIIVPLTSQPLSGVTDVEWSSEPDVALIDQTNGVYLREIPTYNFQTQTLYRIGGSEIVSPVWDPTNPDRIAFGYFSSSGEKSLIFSDKRATSVDRKADLSAISDPKIIWAGDASGLILIGRSADSSQNNIWLYTTADGTLKRLTDGGNVLNASFSPDNKTVLYETATSDPSNPVGSTLSVMKVDGSDKFPLNIAGKVSQAAWKDSTSFFLPNSNGTDLSLYTIGGEKTSVSIAYANTREIQGMYYFHNSQTLIFWTQHAIYTVSLSH